MKLASLKDGRDGALVVVSRDLARAATAPVATLQAALDAWPACAPELERLSDALDAGTADAFDLDPARLAAPLPRAYQWADGSAYLSHVELVRKARGAELPPSLLDDPLMYQGGSDDFLGARDPIVVADEGWGVDLEGEVAVIVDDVPMGIGARAALACVRLVTLVNDVSLRGLIPGELAKGFGFFHGKPASALAPVAVTPDELGDAWRDGKLHLPLLVHRNGAEVGRANAGIDMQFGFGRLIAHAARTRALGVGTIVGAGTVSNRDPDAGWSCIAEARARETIARGAPETPFLRFGDRVRIEMLDAAGNSIFGAIDQEVVKYDGPGEGLER